MLSRLMATIPLISVKKEDIDSKQRLLVFFCTVSVGIILYILKLSLGSANAPYALYLLKASSFTTVASSLICHSCFSKHRHKNNNDYLTPLNALTLHLAKFTFILTILITALY